MQLGCDVCLSVCLSVILPVSDNRLVVRVTRVLPLVETTEVLFLKRMGSQEIYELHSSPWLCTPNLSQKSKFFGKFKKLPHSHSSP